MTQIQLTLYIFRQFVFNATALSLRNLVVRVGTSDFISPLHFIRLYNELADLLLSVLSWCKGNDKVCSIFAVGLEQT